MSIIKQTELTEEILLDILPHGSGINWDWKIQESKDGESFVAKNCYEHMNEVGIYDFNAPFQVIIPKENPMNFEVQWTGTEKQIQQAEDDDLKSYLEDTIAESLPGWLKIA